MLPYHLYAIPQRKSLIRIGGDCGVKCGMTDRNAR
jgi:hypothetical protein